jgi:hypothetical protein
MEWHVLFAASRRKAGWDEGRIIKNFVIRGSFSLLPDRS